MVGESQERRPIEASLNRAAVLSHDRSALLLLCPWHPARPGATQAVPHLRKNKCCSSGLCGLQALPDTKGWKQSPRQALPRGCGARGAGGSRRGWLLSAAEAGAEGQGGGHSELGGDCEGKQAA